MKTIKFALCVSAALFAPVFVGTSAAEDTWTAAGSPVQATIAGGPWTLGQGGAATTGGAYDGPIPYCTPGNNGGGTALMNPLSIVNTFNPYYFPFVVGSGQNVQGYFDYRPKNINEAVVAATSADAGQTWTFQQIVEQLTTECPNSDSNSVNDSPGGNPAGNDDGEGHPSIISFGGVTWLYTLNRSTPHVDFDGLIVHQLLPGANPLNPLPAQSPFMQPPGCVPGSAPTGNCVQPLAPTANLIAGWNFNNDSNTNVTIAGQTYAQNNTPAPSTGTGVAAVLGMNNNYSFPVGGTTGTITGSEASADVTATTLSSDPLIAVANNGLAANNIAPNDNDAWRIRGPACTKSAKNCGQTLVPPAPTGNGWNNSAPPCTQGAQFMVSTTGYYYIVFQYDWYTTNQGVRDLQALYTTDGSTWTPVGPIQVSGGGSAFNNQITIDFHALGITSVENNPNFGVRLVSVYDPDFIGSPAYSIPAGGNVCSATATGTYTAAGLGSNNQPVVYNNNSGNWRLDEVNVLGTTTDTNPITSDPIVNTTGLVNPDGFLAVVPDTYPIEVLYISKTLNSDYVAPTSYPLCPASIPNGNFNDDVEVVRIATTTNFVNFTDITPFNTPQYNTGTPNTPIQMVNGLSDPSTTSYSGIRWVSGNGALIPLSNGNWGLFFGGGNCLDGDSDAFHAIMYAESNGSDLTKWTVINGINNPIASIATVSGVDPQSGETVTIPSATPVVCQVAACTNNTLPWFSGRVYAPNAIVTGAGAVSLVFAGYDAGFQLGGGSRDYSSYRNIGQVNLSVTPAVLTIAGTTTISAANASATYNTIAQNVTLTATVSSTSPVNFGTVTFTVPGVGIVTSGTVTGGAASATLAIPAKQSAGAYSISTVYNAGGNFLGSMSAPAALTINQVPASVTPNPASKVYGMADPTFTGTLSGFLPADGVMATYGRTAGQTVGAYTISATLSPAAALANYNITYNTASFNITPAVLTVTANSFTQPFGSAIPTLTAAIAGFVNGDMSTVVSGAPALATTATPTSLPGPYPITIGAGTLAAANYSFNLAGGTLTIVATGSMPSSGSSCNGAYTGTFSGNLNIAAGQDCVIVNGGVTGNVQQTGGNLELIGSTVGGDVQVNGGGTFIIGPGSHIQGNLQIQNIPSGSATNQVCGSTVHGDLSYQGNGTAVSIGAAAPVPCAPNTIGGNLTVQNNTASASVVGNMVGNNLTVQNNTAATIVDGNTVTRNLQDQNNTAPTQVYSNVVGNNLQCQGNSSISGGSNAAPSKQGQCSTY